MSKQSSTKRGKQSTAQKQAEARDDFEALPAARPKPGAFGRRGGTARPPTSKQKAASRVKTTASKAGRTGGRRTATAGRGGSRRK